MGASGSVELVCARCGSGQVRSSKPHGFGEQLARALGGVRFHVCSACGARGTHRGSRRRSRGRAQGLRGRPIETRDIRMARSRAIRRVAMVLVAALLGAWMALHAANCAESTGEGPSSPAG